MTTLYTAYADDLTLAEALGMADVEGGCALLTGPTAFTVAKVSAGSCQVPGRDIDLRSVYEARVFTPRFELRWREEDKAVALTEEENLLPPSFPERLDPLQAVATLPARYLIWGDVTGSTPEWTTLRSRQVGTVTLPMAGVTTRRVRLTAREYITADDLHGNAYVAEERLIGFEPYAVEGAE